MQETVKVRADITHRYGDLLVHDGLKLAIRENEFLCICGPSGCGKTTLLSIIVGILPPTSGQVLVDGHDVTLADPRDREAYLEEQIARQKRGEPVDVEWVKAELQRVRANQVATLARTQRRLRLLVLPVELRPETPLLSERDDDLGHPSAWPKRAIISRLRPKSPDGLRRGKLTVSTRLVQLQTAGV